MASAGALLLTHGAGGDRDHPVLRELELRLALPVKRLNFANRAAGKKGPEQPAAAVDQIVESAAEMVKRERVRASRLVLGGRSFGGRMCSLAVAERGVRAAGLVLLSYPLHPPGQPSKLRVDHFEGLDVPCLFVSGRNDPFGSPARFRYYTRRIPGSVSLAWVDGGHDPKDHARVVDIVENWLLELP